MTWQKNLAQGFSNVDELLEFLSLPLKLGSALAEKQFRTRIPRGFAARMQAKNPKDPLLLQVLAIDKELENTKGYQTDPLKESKTNLLSGLIHKYHGRVLLTFTGVCAIHCRYCFRRHFPYQKNNPGREGWQEAINYIRNDETITEVILSGGDPLLASNSILAEVIAQLETIAHLRILRFHTRIPIVLPERIDDALLNLLSASSLTKVIVLHCNHPQELDESVEQVCQKLRKADCHLLNQSVLLKAINDEVDILADLSMRLFSFGVLPYYLHVLDKVAGTAHFDVNDHQARALHLQLQAKLPGYLVPRLVREVPEKPHKILL